MAYLTARLGDTGTHGGQVITGSDTRVVNNRPVVRIGDIYECPIHGPNRVIEVKGNLFTDGRATAHHTAQTECGAQLVVIQGEEESALAAEERDQIALDDEPGASPTPFASLPPYRRARMRALFGDPPTSPPAQQNEEPPQPVQEQPTECDQVGESPPDSFRLSPNFTLGMLSTQALISKDRVRANVGLTVPQIVCNLKAVAENCAEALRSRYGSIQITSGFRAGRNQSSQHERGQAIDVQFGGISDEEYWNRAQWVKDNVPYDQFILEYLGTRPWFHLSFNRSGNRRQVLTASYPGRYEPGLRRYR